MVAALSDNLNWGEVYEAPDGERVKHYPLHEGQWDILNSGSRFNAFVGGTGSGKTAIGPLWCIMQMRRVIQSGRDLEANPIKGLIVAPTYPILARATVPEFVTALKGTLLEGRFVPSRNLYVLPNGWGLIYIVAAENPRGLEGGQFDFAWVDEGGQIKYDAWVALQGRLGARQAPCLITTTPYGQNWLFHRFYKFWKAGYPDYYVRTVSSIMNPAYPIAEYERARREMSPQRFAMRYDGSFVKMEGLVFPEYDRCIEMFKECPPGRHFGGCDWGYSPDPFAALAAVLDANNVLWLWYNRSVRNTLIDDNATAIPANVRYFYDPSNPEGAARMRKYGHKMDKARVRDIAVGLDMVNARIYTGRLKIHPKCRALISEMGEYRYPEKDDEIIATEPIGEHHSIDCLRYMVSSIDVLSGSLREAA